jgi:O-antigen/teichoic acid export membrane protein
MSTAKKILGNTVIQVLGRAVMAVVSIGILKAVSDFLSVDGYGQYTAVYEFLAFFGIAADFGLFTIGVREMSKGERDKNFIAGNIFGMRIFTAAITMALAVILAFVLPQYQGTFIPIGISIAAISVFLTILQGTVSSVLQVELKMEYATIGLVGGKVLSFLWMLAAIYYFYTGTPTQEAFDQLMIAGVVGNGFALLFTYRYAAKYAHLTPRYEKAYWKEIFKGAFPYGIALVFNMIYFRIDSVMLLFMKGSHELGYYGPAVRMLEILQVIPVYFMNSVLPVLSKALQEDSKKVERILTLSMNFLFMAALPVAIGIYMLAYPIIFLTTQPEFLSQLDKGIYGSDVALQILCIAMAISFNGSLYNYSLVALGKQSKLLWINAGAAVLNITLNLFVIPAWGFRGASWATVVTEIFILLISGTLVRRYLKYRVDWKTFAKTLFAAGMMAVIVELLKEPSYEWLGLQNLNVILLAGIGCFVYVGLLWVLKAFPEEVRRRMV